MVQAKSTLLPCITFPEAVAPTPELSSPAVSLWSLCFACQAGNTPRSQKKLEDMEQDWGITFHQEDSFILGYLGSEIGTSDSSKDRLQSCRKHGEKKFERSSNLPHLQSAICGTFVQPVLKTLQRPSACDRSLGGFSEWQSPGRGKRRLWLLPGSAAALHSSHSCLHRLWSAIWHCGKAGCYISQCQLRTKAKKPPLEQILSQTQALRRFFFLAPKRVAAEPGAYCTMWEDFAPILPILSFLIISVSISIHQIRDF